VPARAGQRAAPEALELEARQLAQTRKDKFGWPFHDLFYRRFFIPRCDVRTSRHSPFHVVPDLIPRPCERRSFDCLASPPHYPGHRSLMDSSLDVTIAKKQIGPDVEAAIGDTSCGRCGSWFPAKIAALGDAGHAATRPRGTLPVHLGCQHCVAARLCAGGAPYRDPDRPPAPSCRGRRGVLSA
jgi:hypothetical protein